MQTNKPDTPMEFLIILLLIILNGFFAMSEIAMISARRSNLEMQARQGDAGRGRRRSLSKTRTNSFRPSRSASR